MLQAPVTEIFENLKRFFVFAEPSLALQEYVEFFAESSAVQKEAGDSTNVFACRMFPSYTPTFFINLTGDYRLQLDQQRFHIPAKQDVLLLRDTSVQRFNSSADNIFTVKFHPGILRQLFDVEPAQLAGSLLALDALLPKALLQAIKRADSFSDRVTLMSNYLLEKTHGCSADFNWQTVGGALHDPQWLAGQTPVAEIAANLHISSKTLNRYFVKELGVSPKKYFSVLRFRKALYAYLHSRHTFHPFDYGYYDHSHFSREVLQFTGKRLKQQ